MNQPIEEKAHCKNDKEYDPFCDGCKEAVWVASGRCVCHQPIEEKWKERFNEIMPENWSDNGVSRLAIISFIENLLEQERKKVRDILYQDSYDKESGDIVLELMAIINK